MNVNKALIGFVKNAFGVLIILVVVYATVQMCKIGYDFGYRVFTEPAMEEAPGQDVMIQIKEDMSASEMGQMLEDKGLVQDANLFVLQLKLSAYSEDMLPGVYTLNTSMTAKDMMVEIATVNAEKAASENNEQDAQE